MFDKYLNMTDASKADPKDIEQAYNLLKEYCTEQNINLVDFISNINNIKPAAEHIHKNLNFAVRIILKKDKLEQLIHDNLKFIQNKAIAMHKKEFGKLIVKKSPKSVKTTTKKK